jgi:hypothetical protein
VTFWWVNQNQTWRHEIYGGYLWSPKLDAKGRHNRSYDNMTRLQPGDIVFSHFAGALRYVGVVIEQAESSRKPDFGFAGDYWSDEGWSVNVRFVELVTSIKPQDHLDLYNQFAPERYGPMNEQGRVNQQYLFEIPTVLGDYYLDLSRFNEELIKDAVRYDPSIENLIQEAEQILNDPALTITERHVLARARVGQGIYKEQVRRFEPSCRLTGLTEPNYLIASHMKPWRESNNTERLDGHNGLLLSPHVDHLFDRGLITFTNSGRVVASTRLNTVVPQLWKLDLSQEGKRFSRKQIPYLEYHRDEVFQGAKLLHVDQE